ncbi:MAG: L-asparaginase 2, partial [Actinobacteria bacterium]|nr:L-asparaginase 2 [Actinomycetota bacterium]
RDVRKTDNNRVDTFASAEWGALGVVDSDRIVFRRAIGTRHTVNSGLHVPDSVAELPMVAVVADFAG